MSTPSMKLIGRLRRSFEAGSLCRRGSGRATADCSFDIIIQDYDPEKVAATVPANGQTPRVDSPDGIQMHFSLADYRREMPRPEDQR